MIIPVRTIYVSALLVMALSKFSAANAQVLHLGYENDTVQDSSIGVGFKTAKPNNENTKLLCLVDGKELVVTQSGKHFFDIYNVTSDVIVVLRPVGFCTPAGVYRISKKDCTVTKLFESSEVLSQSSDKLSVDYSYSGFDKPGGKIKFRVFENLRDADPPITRDPRVVADIYVYLN